MVHCFDSFLISRFSYCLRLVDLIVVLVSHMQRFFSSFELDEIR
jgi:hypothetical protein